jgi:hypothetical protein
MRYNTVERASRHPDVIAGFETEGTELGFQNSRPLVHKKKIVAVRVA